MQIKRLFTTDGVKGSRNYLHVQKKYEIARTVLYFSISLILFVSGYIQTGERANLLTIVAALGCLPASKSAVIAIMFCRFQSCSQNAAEIIEASSNTLLSLYDSVFTSDKRNYKVAHLVVHSGTICGYTEDAKFAENEFYKHIGNILESDGHKDITVKIFTDLSKYTNRLKQLTALETDVTFDNAIVTTLKSVSL